jgi:hypothetical protein
MSRERAHTIATEWDHFSRVRFGAVQGPSNRTMLSNVGGFFH